MSNSQKEVVPPIREMKAGDEPLIASFFDKMGPESRGFFDRAGFNRRKAIKYCAEGDPTRRYWMATLNGEMVGLVFFFGWNTGIPSLGIAVRDDVKGKHLGSRLMDFAINEARRAGKGGIQLTTHIANLRGQVLYEKKGFECMGQYKNGVELFYLLAFKD